MSPVDTERKMNIHKTFRRRLGRLLNVLRTFNIRPVSTGSEYLRLLLDGDWLCTNLHYDRF